jgi:hypothetical protein
MTRPIGHSGHGHADVAFTMRQYVQTDLEVHRQVATALAELIIGGTVSTPLAPGSLRAHTAGSHAGSEESVHT